MLMDLIRLAHRIFAIDFLLICKQYFEQNVFNFSRQERKFDFIS